MSDVSQVERQLHILALLSENSQGFTAEEILHSLRKIGVDVSGKTVRRDIDYISKNFFVYEEEKDGNTVYLAKKYSAQHVAFSISELLSLYFAREVLNSYRRLDVGETATKIIERIIASMPKISKLYLDTLKDSMKVNVTGINSEDYLDPQHLIILKEAIEEAKCVKLEYYSFNNDEMTNRVLEPYLMEINEGCWHVVGHCRLRNSTRDLRVSRIKSIILTNETFKRPKNFYENYKKSKFDKLSGEERVSLRLRFTGYAARLIDEYEYEKADRIIKENDYLIFERKVALSPEIIKWILSYGAEVKVLEPEGLREEVIKQVKKMGEVYEVT